MPSNRDLAKKLDDLKNMGFLTFDTRRFENNTTYVELTPLGISIAKDLQSIQDRIKNSVSKKPSTNDVSLVKKNKPENISDLPAERWKFIKKPCGDIVLFTLLETSSITIFELKKKCKGEESYLEDRIREAESLDLIIGLHPDGPKSEIRYSLTVDGRNMAENLRRSMECQEVVAMDYGAPSEVENTVKR